MKLLPSTKRTLKHLIIVIFVIAPMLGCLPSSFAWAQPQSTPEVITVASQPLAQETTVVPTATATQTSTVVIPTATITIAPTWTMAPSPTLAPCDGPRVLVMYPVEQRGLDDASFLRTFIGMLKSTVYKPVTFDTIESVRCPFVFVLANITWYFPFSDSMWDNTKEVVKILTDAGYPAVISVTTGGTGNGDKQMIKYIQGLVADNGWQIAVGSLINPTLTYFAEARVRSEIADAMAVITRDSGLTPNALVLPWGKGGKSQLILDVAKAAGIKWVVGYGEDVLTNTLATPAFVNSVSYRNELPIYGEKDAAMILFDSLFLDNE